MGLCYYCGACCCPPLAVFLRRDGCDNDFWVNVLLTCFGWAPGCCHACCCVEKPQQSGVIVNTNVNVNAGPPVSPMAYPQPMPQYVNQPQYPIVHQPMAQQQVSYPMPPMMTMSPSVQYNDQSMGPPPPQYGAHDHNPSAPVYPEKY